MNQETEHWGASTSWPEKACGRLAWGFLGLDPRFPRSTHILLRKQPVVQHLCCPSQQPGLLPQEHGVYLCSLAPLLDCVTKSLASLDLARGLHSQHICSVSKCVMSRNTPYFLDQQPSTHTLRLRSNVISSEKYSLISPNKNNCAGYSKHLIHTAVETCITVHTI